MPDKVFWCLLCDWGEEHTGFSFHQQKECGMVFAAGQVSAWLQGTRQSVQGPIKELAGQPALERETRLHVASSAPSFPRNDL